MLIIEAMQLVQGHETVKSMNNQVRYTVRAKLYRTVIFVFFFVSSLQAETVIRVPDGDTITVKTSTGLETIRLIGIDAPELKHGTRIDAECYGKESQQVVYRLLLNKDVRLIRKGKDRYGRTLAYVYYRPVFPTKDSHRMSINRWLVLEGYASSYRKNRHRYAESFDKAESEAKQRRVGMWSCP